MQVNEEISCDKDATVRAQYIIQGEELKKGPVVEVDFFYLVRFIWWLMSYTVYLV